MSKKLLGSIRTKLFFALFVIGVVPLTLLTALVFDSLRQDFNEQMTTELLWQANTISTSLSVDDYLDNTSHTVFLDDIQAVISHRFIIINVKGEVVYDTNDIDSGKMYSSTEVLRVLQGLDRFIVNGGDDFITVYTPVHDTNTNAITGLVLIVGDASEIETTIVRLRSLIGLFYVAILLGVMICNLYFSTILTQPIKKFLYHIRRISQGHIHERLTIKGNYEIEAIGEAVNTMLTTIEEIDHSRQQFVANVSHELKTPLSSMKVLAESLLLQENAPIEFYREFMEDISSEVDRETQIINDLLTLVTLDQTENQLNLSAVDVNHLTEQVLRMLKPVAEQKKVTLEIKSYRDITALMDETKFYLVLMNLVENAIKYNQPAGKVTVSINADHRDMILKVIDTGIGIPEDSVSKIFERFYRVDKTRSRDTGGTGLGLNIVHKTVLLLGGTIKCSSIEDQGTTFTVRLPLTQVVLPDEL